MLGGDAGFVGIGKGVVDIDRAIERDAAGDVAVPINMDVRLQVAQLELEAGAAPKNGHSMRLAGGMKSGIKSMRGRKCE